MADKTRDSSKLDRVSKAGYKASRKTADEKYTEYIKGVIHLPLKDGQLHAMLLLYFSDLSDYQGHVIIERTLLRLVAKTASILQAERLDRPRIICLCGSTRFIREFSEHYARLTDEGCIVLTVGRVVPQHEQHLERKRKLDELHLRKIDLADEVFVINVCGYIGESTSNEITYAEKLGKPIKYLEEVDG